MKTCSNPTCSQINPQPLEAFFRDKGFKDGHAATCKVCKTAKAMEWRATNKERYNLTMRTYQKKHYGRLRLQRYDLTPQQYADMLAAQKGVCFLCDKAPTGKRPLAIDHCHESGKVRGLLCYGCNRLMVLIDDAGLLAKALAYKAKIPA